MSKRFRNRFERSPRDFYATPLRSVLPLVPHLVAARLRSFCEPCAGNGDLVRHLESFGLRCVYQGDIATGQDALAIERFCSPVITNPPYTRGLLLPLIDHFLTAAPFSWLLLPADFAHVAYARPWHRHSTDIVSAGRAKWFGGSGTENIAWFRFASAHVGGPVVHNGDALIGRTALCAGCDRAFRPARLDARFCSAACKQRAYRTRLAVTEA
jgi:hypothetical protein